MVDSKTIWNVVDSLKSKDKTVQHTTQAVVNRIDNEGRVWVSIPGGETETPTETSDAEVKRGDNVTVEWRGGKLYVLGNSTTPATSVQRVRKIVGPVEELAQEAANGVGDAIDASKAAQQAAQEAAEVSRATSQHFWYRSDAQEDNGAFVTDMPKEDWLAGEADNFSDWQPDPEEPDYKPYNNSLWNSLGLLIRTAKNNLVSITKSATAFFDGDGNNASNVVASFGKDGAVIGKTDETHTVVDYHSLQLLDKEGKTFFHVSDLRDKDDDYQATITEVFRGDGAQTEFSVELPVSGEVSATDSSDPSNTATRRTRMYTFQAAPANGATVTIVYKTKSTEAKAYTFGIRGRGNIGPLSVAEGSDNIANGFYSHAEGYVTTASGRYSHAQGSGSTSSGDESHAEGHGTTASGFSSHAEGSETTASGDDSHSEGARSIASGECSHAEGFFTTASGDNSHAEGYYTTASGDSSHAEGFSTTASGNHSHTQNYYTIAQRKSQTALGEYNIADTGGTDETTRGDYAVIVGNGTGESNRSNALTVDWSGNVWTAGNITDGSGNVLSDKANTTDLANYLPLTGGTLEGGTGTYALMVNDGTGDTLTIDWDGNTWASGVFTSERSSSGNTGFVAKRPDTGHEMQFIIGSGGTNRGIYDIDMTDWALFWNNAGTGYIRSKASSGVNTWAFRNDGILEAPERIYQEIDGTGTRFTSTMRRQAYNATTSSFAAPSANCFSSALTIFDNQGNWVGAFQHNYSTANSSYVRMTARRWYNNALTENVIDVGVGNNGRYYYVSDQAAFRSAIGLVKSSIVTTVADIITASTNITLKTCRFITYGGIAMLEVNFTKSTATADKAGFQVGTVVSGKRPALEASASTNNLIGHVATNGQLHVRNVSGTQIAANANMAIRATYILA